MTSYVYDESGNCMTIDAAGPVEEVETVWLTMSQGPIRVQMRLSAQDVIDLVARAAGIDGVGPFVTLKEAADMFGVSYQWLRQLKMKGRLPDPARRVGRSDQWRVGDFRRWHHAYTSNNSVDNDELE